MTLVIRKAISHDVEQIYNLYEHVAVKNALEKILEQKNFEKRGGIFRIYEKPEILNMIESKKFLVFVALEDSLVVGLRICCKDITLYYPKDNFPEAKKIAFAVNLIIHPDFRRKGISQSLQKESLKQLSLEGYSYLLGEAYTILGYKKDNNFFETRLDNPVVTKLREKAKLLKTIKREFSFENILIFVEGSLFISVI